MNDAGLSLMVLKGDNRIVDKIKNNLLVAFAEKKPLQISKQQ